MELTDDDVLEILKLFEQSKFDFLQLEQGDRKITISKGGYGAGKSEAASAAAWVHPSSAGTAKAAPPPITAPAATRSPTTASLAPKVHTGVAGDGLVPVTAPMVGKFYLAPSPADPPYVEVGSKVAAGTAVGLIEVMKVFASIKTEIAGTIEKILVTNGEFVEFGQPLFLLRPDK